MNKKRVILYASIAVAIIMAITCPSRRDHRDRIYDVCMLQSIEIMKHVGSTMPSTQKAIETEIIDRIDNRMSYYPLLLASICTCDGHLVSIGILSNVIINMPDEERPRRTNSETEPLHRTIRRR